MSVVVDCLFVLHPSPNSKLCLSLQLKMDVLVESDPCGISSQSGPCKKSDSNAVTC